MSAVENGLTVPLPSAHGNFETNSETITETNKARETRLRFENHLLSDLQLSRLYFVPPKPLCLEGTFEAVQEWHSRRYDDTETVASLFPNLSGRPALRLVACANANSLSKGKATYKIGVVLSGGQAPGGHNVICGLLDYLEKRHPGSALYGFLGGCKGIVTQRYRQIRADDLVNFRNQGGFHLIGSGRDKIETESELQAAAEAVTALQLDGLVIIGGDDSNTNAAIIAEYFLQHGVACSVVGVPKTIDGDLKNRHIPISFGFDSATKVYSELIGNIMVDACSAGKYYHFVRLMGRSASHITLECALQTHPQLALISEEVELKQHTLADLAKQISDVICLRAEAGCHHGVVLLPEGLIECVAQLGPLIKELNNILPKEPHLTYLDVPHKLTAQSAEVFQRLPVAIRLQLLLDRDPHGNVKVAQIETEKLLIKLVEAELAERKARGAYKGKFAGLGHYFGYEGRSTLPTNFDATYCYALGEGAAALVTVGATGLMVTIGNMQAPACQWTVGGTPLINMMNIEMRKGQQKAVIKKALVELDSPVYQEYCRMRSQWAQGDYYRSPGPVQFCDHGDSRGGDAASITLALELNEGKPIYIR